MILTDYYKFERVATKAKTRLDCIASTKSYPEFEEKRAASPTKQTEKRDAIAVGDLVVYLTNQPESYGGSNKRKADKSLSIKGKNLSSIYEPDPSNGFGYGDMKGTTDALLFVMKIEEVNGWLQDGGIVEVFVARGQNTHKVNLYNLLTDGELDDEMEELRKQASTK